jgi:acyl dehydratase
MERMENKTFDEIKLGNTASLIRTLTHKDIELFAVMSGDINPTHLDDAFAKSDMFHKVVAHGMWSGALISTVLGTQLPGPGTVYVDQSLHFQGAIGLGDTITVTVTRWDGKGPHRSRDRAGRPYRTVHGGEHTEGSLAADRPLDQRAVGGLVAAIHRSADS